MEITKETWVKIFPTLSSERRFLLLEYFNEKANPVSYTALKEENGLTDGNLVYHLNLLLSAGLIVNKTEKTELGRHPYSFYEITPLGVKVLEKLRE